MQSVHVSGRFVNELKEPTEGEIFFEPSKLMIIQEEVAFATLAPRVQLEDGHFMVHLTRTDQATVPWHYKVHCPIGTWSIKVEGNGPLLLRDLLPQRFRA